MEAIATKVTTATAATPSSVRNRDRDRPLPFEPEVDTLRVAREHDSPVPGKPRVARTLPFRKLIVAPGRPIEVLIPNLLRFSRTPGNSLMRF